MNKIILLIVATLLFNTNISSQGLEDDNMVLLMKANVLFESGRYDEAVRMYNRIISEDENHTMAIFMRSKAKYELGAYRGTKMDILLYIDKIGVNKDVIKLMANTEFKLSNLSSATQYVHTAIELDPYDDKMHLLAGDIALATDLRNDACEHYSSAAQLGNSRAVNRLGESCLGFKPGTSSNRDLDMIEDSGINEETESDPSESTEQKEDDGIVTLEEIVRDAEMSTGETRQEESSDPSATQTVEIDSKLEITLTDGIGNRALQSKPSIFMLSDQDGVVVIDLCIDQDGRVTEATFNRSKSTIYRSSLTSLALRKSKQFVFASDRKSEQCGLMIYNIKS